MLTVKVPRLPAPFFAEMVMVLVPLPVMLEGE
jgi:hypothetical protein